MPTIKDVAKDAGVSVGSVSKYLNGYKLKEKTKEAIEASITKLGYEQNIYAKGLKLNRSFTVVLIVPTIWNPFFSELAFYIERFLRLHKTKLMIFNSNDDSHEEVELFTMARQNKVDGIIAITYSNIEQHLSDDLPVVSIDRFLSAHTHFISSDNEKGGHLAASILHQSGCRHLAYVGHGSEKANATIKRFEGFVSYCENASIPFKKYYTDSNRQDFEKEIETLLDDIGLEKIDGLFVDSDTHAEYLMVKLRNQGIRIPEDVQIVGFDGSKSSKSSINQLTSIRQDVEEIAKQSVQLLMKTIESKDKVKVEHKIIPVSVVYGPTTKAPIER